MRTGHLQAAAMTALVLSLVACAPSDAEPPGDGPAVEAAVPDTRTTPDADPTALLEALLPEVSELPTGGWRLAPSTDDSGDGVGLARKAAVAGTAAPGHARSRAAQAIAGRVANRIVVVQVQDDRARPIAG